MRLENMTLARNGINSDGTIPDGLPFSKTWTPVSYRAAYTYEPIKDLMFYSMYATAYDPAVAAIFSVSPANSLAIDELANLRNWRQADILGWPSGMDRIRCTTSSSAMSYVPANDTTSMSPAKSPPKVSNWPPP